MRSAFSCFEESTLYESDPSVAKTSPSEFFNQVKAEARKIAWPTSRETMMTTVLVVIMTTTLGLFFFGIDTLFGWIVRMLLSLAAGTN